VKGANRRQHCEIGDDFSLKPAIHRRLLHLLWLTGIGFCAEVLFAHKAKLNCSRPTSEQFCHVKSASDVVFVYL
jgi:hypothetical protein